MFNVCLDKPNLTDAQINILVRRVLTKRHNDFEEAARNGIQNPDDTFVMDYTGVNKLVRIGHFDSYTNKFNFDQHEWKFIQSSFVYYNFLTPMYPKNKLVILLEHVLPALHRALYYPNVDMMDIYKGYATKLNTKWVDEKMQLQVVSYKNFLHIVAKWRDLRTKDLKSKLEAAVAENGRIMSGHEFDKILRKNICYAPGNDQHFAYLQISANRLKSIDEARINFKYFLNRILPSINKEQQPVTPPRPPPPPPPSPPPRKPLPRVRTRSRPLSPPKSVVKGLETSV